MHPHVTIIVTHAALNEIDLQFRCCDLYATKATFVNFICPFVPKLVIDGFYVFFWKE